jgi:hypothetical protein
MVKKETLLKFAKVIRFVCESFVIYFSIFGACFFVPALRNDFSTFNTSNLFWLLVIPLAIVFLIVWLPVLCPDRDIAKPKEFDGEKDK